VAHENLKLLLEDLPIGNEIYIIIDTEKLVTNLESAKQKRHVPTKNPNETLVKPTTHISLQTPTFFNLMKLAWRSDLAITF